MGSKQSRPAVGTSSGFDEMRFHQSTSTAAASAAAATGGRISMTDNSLSYYYANVRQCGRKTTEPAAPPLDGQQNYMSSVGGKVGLCITDFSILSSMNFEVFFVSIIMFDLLRGYHKEASYNNTIWIVHCKVIIVGYLMSHNTIKMRRSVKNSLKILVTSQKSTQLQLSPNFSTFQ